jgi:hypothetical protein
MSVVRKARQSLVLFPFLNPFCVVDSSSFLPKYLEHFLYMGNRVIHITDFYQMLQSLKQFLEDYVPKKRHAKFQAGWCP